MAKKTYEQLIADLAIDYADNVVGAITPAIHRAYVTDHLDSFLITSAADRTVYVDPTGSDVTGDGSVGNPFRQIQTAVDILPKNVLHLVDIEAATGSYDAFTLTGFRVAPGARLRVIGELVVPTVDGSTTGTAGTSSTYTVTDAAAGWTTGQLSGKIISVAGENRPVQFNSGTNCTSPTRFSADVNGKTYNIFDWSTVINTAGTSPNASVYVSDCSGNVIIENLDLQAPASTDYGVYAFSSEQVFVKMCKLSCASAGGSAVYFEGIYGRHSAEDCNYGTTWNDACLDVCNCSGHLIRAGGLMTGANGRGLRIDGLLRLSDLEVEAVGGMNPGIHLKNCIYADCRRMRVLNAAGDAIRLENSTLEALDASVTFSGTGNAGYGVNVYRDATLILNKVPTITGTSGDFTVARNAAGTWASLTGVGYPALNSYANDPNIKTLIERIA